MKINAKYISLFTACVILSFPAIAEESKDIPLEVTADKALEWNQENKSYVARGNALAKQGDMSVKADLITASYAGENGSTSDIIRLVAEGHVTLTSGTDTANGEKVTYDLQTGQAVLSGNRPKIIQKGANTLEADIINVWVQNKGDAANSSGQIDRAEATGNVVISNGQQTGTGDKAIYTATTQTAELLGHVKIQQDKNILEGDKAEINLVTHVSKMTNQNKSQRVKGVFYPKSTKKN